MANFLFYVNEKYVVEDFRALNVLQILSMKKKKDFDHLGSHYGVYVLYNP